MTKNSTFIEDYVCVSTAVCTFESWLRQHGYTACQEDYPLAIHATTMLDAFIDAYSEYDGAVNKVKKHAKKIGFISDYQAWDDADDDIRPVLADEDDL